MRKISTFFYQIGQGFVGIVRNGVMSTASVLVLVSCLLIVGTFYMVIDNINTNFETTDNINIIKIYLSDELSDEQIAVIDTKIAKIGEELGNIESYKFYTKAENLARYKETTQLDDNVLNLFTDDNNPLPNSFEILFTKFSDPNFNMDVVFKLKNKLLEIENLKTEDIKENLALYDKVTSIKNTLTIVAAWMMGILLLVSLFVIMNTIKLGLHARRNEIMFMRYCGATKNFIRTPFLIEGIIIGLFSSGVAFGLQYYIYEYLIRDILTGKSSSILVDSGSMASFQLTPFGNYINLVALTFLGIGLFAGIVSSIFSIKKYLKV